MPFSPHNIDVTLRPDGRWTNRPFTAPADVPDEPSEWDVHPIAQEGIFGSVQVDKPDATYSVELFDPSGAQLRWAFFDGGRFVFSAIGAEPGVYSANWMIPDADGSGNSMSGTVEVEVVE